MTKQAELGGQRLFTAWSNYYQRNEAYRLASVMIEWWIWNYYLLKNYMLRRQIHTKLVANDRWRLKGKPGRMLENLGIRDTVELSCTCTIHNKPWSPPLDNLGIFCGRVVYFDSTKRPIGTRKISRSRAATRPWCIWYWLLRIELLRKYWGYMIEVRLDWGL
jgi:hypothetical protein